MLKLLILQVVDIRARAGIKKLDMLDTARFMSERVNVKQKTSKDETTNCNTWLNV